MLQSEICPLKKDRIKLDNDANNYRPVALVCAFSKVLEAALKSRVDFNLCTSQYAYKSGWGTRNALKRVLDWLQRNRYEHGRVFAVWLDLSKAFDMLRYKTIMDSVVAEPAVARLLSDFLSGCSVSIGQEPRIKCRRGVRQVGLISPNLFTNVANEFLEKNLKKRSSGNHRGLRR